ncbi:16S rRNA (cytosine(1402)-N(4))-methyltransferase RsmH [Candidatus Falkowbacteria bacterium]|nr:16S rRNA (cytosine(1402)-N(4))-methyltransferase RsmH [Candidatus Falkowbacteria bacterium]
MSSYHTPAMLDEVMEYLEPVKGGNYLDGTFGGGGYSKRIAGECQPGQVIGFDLDPLAHDQAEIIKASGIDNIHVIPDNFSRMKENLEAEGWLEKIGGFDGLVLDLGLSSAQLADRERGFSFQADTPLDMSFGGAKRSVETTEAIVNGWTEKELERILRQYGEESHSRAIARAIVRARDKSPITTTGQLISAIEYSLPPKARHGQKHFATKTFQALRIATNRELESLELVLAQSLELLKPGGRLVVVSYHSLEDRIVKQFIREQTIDCVCPPTLPVCSCDHRATMKSLTKKPVLPTEEEVNNNPRARSAKLRAAARI